MSDNTLDRILCAIGAVLVVALVLGMAYGVAVLFDDRSAGVALVVGSMLQSTYKGFRQRHYEEAHLWSRCES